MPCCCSANWSGKSLLKNPRKRPNANAQYMGSWGNGIEYCTGVAGLHSFHQCDETLPL